MSIETLLTVAPFLLGVFAVLSFGYMLGRHHCRSGHPRHFDVTEPLPYTADDVRWWADDPTCEVVTAPADDTQVMPAYALPERSVLARYTEPTPETLRRWARDEAL